MRGHRPNHWKLSTAYRNCPASLAEGITTQHQAFNVSEPARYLLRTVRSALALVVIVGLLPGISSACAVCWGADDALGRGISMSIMFLTLMPFLIGGSIAGGLYIAHKQAQGQRFPRVSLRALLGRRGPHKERGG